MIIQQSRTTYLTTGRRLKDEQLASSGLNSSNRKSRYVDEFNASKIIYPEMSQGQKFSIAPGPLYINNKAFYIPKEDFELLGFLNSQLCWFFPRRHCLSATWRSVAGWELRDEYIRQVPVPESVIAGTSGLGPLAKTATEAANQRLQQQRGFVAASQTYVRRAFRKN